LDPDRFWIENALHYLDSVGCDGRIGRHSPPLLERRGYVQIAMDYVIVDTIRVPRTVFAGILRAWREADGLNVAEVEDLPAPPSISIPADLRFLAEILERVMPELGEDYAALEAHYDDAQWVSCRLAEVLAMEAFERQALLELDDPLDRLQMLLARVRGDG
jgi:hypothetical protein